MKNKRGYFGVGVYGMKNSDNYGTLIRTANILGADFIFVIGKRFKAQCTDTTKAHRHIPVFEYETIEEFHKYKPHGCRLVGIELDESAVDLKNFDHPKQCAYLLGAEDSGISKNALSHCDSIVKLYGEASMNVSVAGSIVLYDRINKLN